MPLYKLYCPNHKDMEFKVLAKSNEDLSQKVCDICGTTLIKNVGNIAVSTINEMANRKKGNQLEVDFKEKMEKRKKEHFLNKEVYDIIDADRGTMDRDAMKKHNIFTKEGGKIRVRKKSDLK